jgi:chorismate dehydratase
VSERDGAESKRGGAAVLRLGAPQYLAARPCLEGLDDDPRFKLERATPAALIDMLHSGAVDAALVSSIEAFRRPGYRYVPSVGIVALRRVMSVLLFAREPLEQCTSVALDPASRAGAALAQIVLSERGRGRVRVVEVRPGADPAEAGTDCWVRIGDAALKEGHAARGARAIDLAESWFSLTGLPFVFALWLVRKDVLFTSEDARSLVRARDRGVERSDAIARGAARELGLPEDFLRDYLGGACHYSLETPGVAEGLREFHRRAAALGLADPSIEPAASHL